MPPLDQDCSSDLFVQLMTLGHGLHALCSSGNRAMLMARGGSQIETTEDGIVTTVPDIEIGSCDVF
jgi:hypothetical protein